MDSPLVTFIVPTYNRAYILEEAIQSIRAQIISVLVATELFQIVSFIQQFHGIVGAD